MKLLLLLFFGLTLQSSAQALSTVYGYDYSAPAAMQAYLSLVDGNAPRNGDNACRPVYDHMMTDGVIDIRYALGYFDDSTGKQNIWNGVNWGYSPSLDIVMFEGLIRTFTSRCSSRSLRLCGFSLNGDPQSGKVVLQKYLTLFGEKQLVRITLTQASASEYYEKNKGELADRQAFLTRQSEENFFGGLKEADIVFYNGHSRDGGGPDFKMPVLNSLKKDNYIGYYHIKKEGITRMMSALESNPNKDILVGMFSCYARHHFYDTFMNANPRQRIILSEDTIDYFDAMEGSLGYLEMLLRGSCAGELAFSARQKDRVRRGFNSFNMF